MRAGAGGEASGRLPSPLRLGRGSPAPAGQGPSRGRRRCRSPAGAESGCGAGGGDLQARRGGLGWGGERRGAAAPREAAAALGSGGGRRNAATARSGAPAGAGRGSGAPGRRKARPRPGLAAARRRPGSPRSPGGSAPARRQRPPPSTEAAWGGRGVPRPALRRGETSPLHQRRGRNFLSSAERRPPGVVPESCALPRRDRAGGVTAGRGEQTRTHTHAHSGTWETADCEDALGDTVPSLPASPPSSCPKETESCKNSNAQLMRGASQHP